MGKDKNRQQPGQQQQGGGFKKEPFDKGNLGQGQQRPNDRNNMNQDKNKPMGGTQQPNKGQTQGQGFNQNKKPSWIDKDKDKQ